MPAPGRAVRDRPKVLASSSSPVYSPLRRFLPLPSVAGPENDPRMSAKAPPPSSSLRPPTEGGASKYTAIIALLAAGLLGLLVWKHFSGDPSVEQRPPPTPVATTPPANSREDDIPPPPPEEDSGPDTGAPKSTAPSNWASCDAKTCGGSVTSDLESVLAFRAKAAHRCYDEALAQDSTLKGTVKIAVRVAANGNLCSANVAASDLSNPSVASCIANRFRQAGHFPAPAGGCLDVNVPISLMPPH